MLAIRMQRVGRKKQPLYRVVVSEKTKDMYGNHLEILGQYNPHTKEATLKEDRIKHWLGIGAQASESLFNLLLSKGIVEGKKHKAVKISKKRQAKKEKDKAAKEAKETKVEEKADQSGDAKEEVKAEEAKTEETKDASVEASAKAEDKPAVETK